MKRIIGLLIAGAVAVGLGGLAAAPAAAFAPITYTPNCPQNSIGEEADWQRLTIRNYSGSVISVTAWEDYPNGQLKPLGTTGTSTTGEVTTFNADGDVVRWEMTGGGNLNWYYHVNCFY